MKLVGTCLAAAVVVGLGLSLTIPQSEAATTTCTVTTVKNFKGACPPGMKYAGGKTGNLGILPDPLAPPAATVTPTSGPAGCVKTNVKNLKNSCNAAS